MYRHSFNRGPARNDTEITEDNKSVCMKSFRNLSTADTIRIAGGGTLPKSDNFIKCPSIHVNFHDLLSNFLTFYFFIFFIYRYNIIYIYI